MRELGKDEEMKEDSCTRRLEEAYVTVRDKRVNEPIVTGFVERVLDSDETSRTLLLDTGYTVYIEFKEITRDE